MKIVVNHLTRMKPGYSQGPRDRQRHKDSPRRGHGVVDTMAGGSQVAKTRLPSTLHRPLLSKRLIPSSIQSAILREDRKDAEQSSRGAGQLFTLDRERFPEQERCGIRDFFGRNVFDRSGSTPIVGQAVAKVAVQRKGG